MDAKNPFETPITFRLHRAEYLVGCAVSAILIGWHWRQVNWGAAAALFLYIDLIGYIPGAIAHHRSRTGQISKAYYVLYNTMHSLLTQGAVVALYGVLIGWQWTLLVIPFHLFGDRGIFGNFLKPFNLPFEPEANRGYARLIMELTSDSGRKHAPVATASADPVVR
jgi:ABC-type phosphate/phosphonate transport system permease subunit